MQMDLDVHGMKWILATDVEDLTILQTFSQTPCAARVEGELEEELVLYFLLTPVLARIQPVELQTIMEMVALGMKKAHAIDVDITILTTFSLMLCAVDVEEEVVDQLFLLIYALVQTQITEPQIHLDIHARVIRTTKITRVIDVVFMTMITFSQNQCVAHVVEALVIRPIILIPALALI